MFHDLLRGLVVVMCCNFAARNVLCGVFAFVLFFCGLNAINCGWLVFLYLFILSGVFERFLIIFFYMVMHDGCQVWRVFAYLVVQSCMRLYPTVLRFVTV